jgi:hypothetical protein
MLKHYFPKFTQFRFIPLETGKSLLLVALLDCGGKRNCLMKEGEKYSYRHNLQAFAIRSPVTFLKALNLKVESSSGSGGSLNAIFFYSEITSYKIVNT